jgi:hypothetical protein
MEVELRTAKRLAGRSERAHTQGRRGPAKAARQAAGWRLRSRGGGMFRLTTGGIVKALTVVAAVLIAAVLAAASAAAPQRDALIRPGIGIGEVRLGMSRADVQRVLGAPTLVNRRLKVGFRDDYLELDWDSSAWRVGIRGRPGAWRVVRIGTTTRSERTASGIGTGSTLPVVVRRYPSATCVHRNYHPDIGTWVLLPKRPGAAMTALWLIRAKPGYAPRQPPIVGEVLVQERWISGATLRCEPGWRTWRW